MSSQHRSNDVGVFVHQLETASRRASVAPPASQSGCRHRRTTGHPPTPSALALPDPRCRLMARKPSIPSCPCLVDAASRAISPTCTPTSPRPAPCTGYSVCNDFVHGPGPVIVWRATQEGRRVSWLSLALYFCTAHAKIVGCKPLSAFFCASLDRTPDIARGLVWSTLRSVSLAKGFDYQNSERIKCRLESISLIILVLHQRC